MKTIFDYLLVAVGFFLTFFLNGCEAEKELNVIETDDVVLYDQIYMLRCGK